MSGLYIRCCCNNAAVIVMINIHTSNNPMAMHLLRCLFFICARFSIILSAEHIAGIRNEAADALSRYKRATFHLKIPTASRTPSTIPPALMEVLVSQKPNWLSESWSRAFQDCF